MRIVPLLFLLSLAFLPGSVRRWLRYRERPDRWALTANVGLGLVAAWQYLAYERLGWSDSFIGVAAMSVLWCIAVAMIGVSGYLQYVLAAELGRRLVGKAWWKRFLYGLGIVEFGHPPDQVPRIPPSYSGDLPHQVNVTASDRRRLGTIALALAPPLIAIWAIGEFAIDGSSAFARVSHFGLTFGILAAAVGAFDLFLARMATRRRKPGHCAKCGYDLRGLPEPRCPECGKRFKRSASTDNGSGAE